MRTRIPYIHERSSKQCVTNAYISLMGLVGYVDKSAFTTRKIILPEARPELWEPLDHSRKSRSAVRGGQNNGDELRSAAWDLCFGKGSENDRCLNQRLQGQISRPRLFQHSVDLSPCAPSEPSSSQKEPCCWHSLSSAKP